MEQNNKQLKEFTLSQVLSVTSGRPLTDSKFIKQLLDYLNDSELSIEQIPSAIVLGNAYLLSIYPELRGIGVDEHFESLDDFKKFIAEQSKIHGTQFVFAPMQESLRVSTTPEKSNFEEMLQLAENTGLSRLVNSFDYSEVNQVKGKGR